MAPMFLWGGNPTIKHKRSLQKLVNKSFDQHILIKKENNRLVSVAPRVPIIYYLPKVHKSVGTPPGHPINSSINSITSYIGKYIDSFLQPLVVHSASYLKNTAHI